MLDPMAMGTTEEAISIFSRFLRDPRGAHEHMTDTDTLRRTMSELSCLGDLWQCEAFSDACAAPINDYIATTLHSSNNKNSLQR